MQKEVILVQGNKFQSISNTLNNLELWTDISIIATAIAAIVGVIIAWYQLGKVKEQIAFNYKRAIRENAVNHALRWTSLNIETDSASRIAENLTPQQAENLFKFKVIEIEGGENIEFLKDIFGEKYQPVSIDGNTNKVKLEIREVKKLRHHVNYWMNMLESILIAYRHGIADEKIIEEEFEAFLFKGSKKEFILESVYQKFGKESAYPGIYALKERVKKKYKLEDPESLNPNN